MFEINFNTILSVGAMVGLAIVSIVQKNRQTKFDEIHDRIAEIRTEQIRQADRIDKIYDHLINGKSKDSK